MCYLAGMRSNDVFARMTREEAQRFLSDLREHKSPLAAAALGAAAEAFRMRPAFLRRQPAERQAEWMRRALARPRSVAVAEEILADFFLGPQRDLLCQLLDALGVPHQNGELTGKGLEPPSGPRLEQAVAEFRKGPDPERRELLLRAFAAQSAIAWPDLEKLLATS